MVENVVSLKNKASNDLPSFVRDDYATFAAFLDAYHSWLDLNQADVKNLIDVDTTLASFIRNFKLSVDYRNFQFPHIDERFLLRHIKQLYLSKGTEESYRTLFKLLYNKDVVIRYPEQQTLKASSGKWIQVASIFVEVGSGDATTLENKIVKVTDPLTNNVFDVTVERVVLRKVGGGLSTVALANGGTGYTTPTVTFVGGGGGGALGVAVVDGGVITQILVTSAGSGYTSTPQVMITGSNTAPATVAQVFINFKNSVYECNINKSYFGNIGIGGTVTYGTFSGMIIPTIVKMMIESPGTGFRLGQTYDVDTVFGEGTIIKVTKLIPLTNGVAELKFIKFGFGYVTDFTSDLIPPILGVTDPLQGFNGLNGSFVDYTHVNPDGGYISNDSYSQTPGQELYSNDYAGTIEREFIASNQYNGNSDSGIRVRFTLGAVCKYPGNYISSDGIPSDENKIQDSRFYQKYSYVIQADEQLATYADVVKSLIHPAGLAMFGEYSMSNSLSVKLKLTSLFSVFNIRSVESVTMSDANVMTFAKVISDLSNGAAFTDVDWVYLSESLIYKGTAKIVNDLSNTALGTPLDAASGTDASVNHFEANKTDAATTDDTHIKDVSTTYSETILNSDSNTYSLDAIVNDASTAARGAPLDWTANTDQNTYSATFAQSDSVANADSSFIGFSTIISDVGTTVTDDSTTFVTSYMLTDSAFANLIPENFSMFMPSFGLADSFSISDFDINSNIPFTITYVGGTNTAFLDSTVITDGGSVVSYEYIVGVSTYVAGDYVASTGVTF